MENIHNKWNAKHSDLTSIDNRILMELYNEDIDSLFWPPITITVIKSRVVWRCVQNAMKDEKWFSWKN
jgi:hypothetical protein